MTRRGPVGPTAPAQRGLAAADVRSSQGAQQPVREPRRSGAAPAAAHRLAVSGRSPAPLAAGRSSASRAPRVRGRGGERPPWRGAISEGDGEPAATVPRPAAGGGDQRRRPARAAQGRRRRPRRGVARCNPGRELDPAVAVLDGVADDVADRLGEADADRRVTSAETGSTVQRAAAAGPRARARRARRPRSARPRSTVSRRRARPGPREIVERQRRAPQLEVDRLDARGAARGRRAPAARPSADRAPRGARERPGLCATAARVQRAHAAPAMHDQRPRRDAAIRAAAISAGAGRSATGPSIKR